MLAGKYRIEKILGAGGMGVVVAAYHLQLDQRVAIKFLLPEVLGNAEAVGRFVREARASVKIMSEHVARVIDVGTLENSAPFMVMEYLDGGDLSAWLEQRGALPIEQAVEFILQACEAIAEAHGLGIVHRDLKPANLFCIRRPDGILSVKVLDFGISKLTGSQLSGSGMGMTRTTSVMGSPLYMSPEQLQSSRDVDTRTDIWSLGVVLYELLTKQVPFAGETLPELCIKIVNQPTPLIRNVRPDVPIGLEQVVCKCLEKDRNKRYLNVAELAVALSQYGPKRARASVERVRGIIQSAGLSASVLALPPSSETNSQPLPVQTEVSWGQTARPASTRKKWIIVGALGVVTTLVIAAALLMKTNSGSRGVAAASANARTESSMLVPAEPPTTIATGAPIAVAPEPDVGKSVTTTTNPDTQRDAKNQTGNSPRHGTGHSAPGANQPAPTTLAPPPKASGAVTKPSCDPPFTLDEQGRKHFKRECYN